MATLHQSADRARLEKLGVVLLKTMDDGRPQVVVSLPSVVRRLSSFWPTETSTRPWRQNKDPSD